MEILEAFDLTGSLRGAAELVGCDHKTVAHWVAARDAAGGGLPVAARPRPTVDRFAAKIEKLVERSHGKMRADEAHEKLVAMGYVGSESTTRNRDRGVRGFASAPVNRGRYEYSLATSFPNLRATRARVLDLEQERGLACDAIDADRSDLVQLGAFLADRERDVSRSSTSSWLRSSTSCPTARRAQRAVVLT